MDILRVLLFTNILLCSCDGEKRERKSDKKVAIISMKKNCDTSRRLEAISPLEAEAIEAYSRKGKIRSNAKRVYGGETKVERHEDTLRSIYALMGVRKSKKTNKEPKSVLISRLSSEREKDGGSNWKKLSKSYLQGLEINTIQDADDILSSAELSELALKLPCVDAHPDLLIPAEDIFKNRFRANTTKPNDQFFNEAWHLRTSGATTAWNVFTGSSHGMTIAIVDTGCSFHPDLANNLWIDPENPNCTEATPNNPTKEYGCYGVDVTLPENQSVWFSPHLSRGNPLSEELYHGTSVAGVAAATTNNNFQTAGICWGCKVMCIKVADFFRYIRISYLLQAYEILLEKNVKISNHSYGFFGFDSIVSEAISRLNDADHLFVTSAGNDACDVDRFGGCGYLMPGGLTFDRVLTVGAVNEFNSQYSLSNWGATSVDIFAPGESLQAIYNTRSSRGPVTLVSGTSFASPLVAGAAALVWGANPTWNALQVKNRLLSTAKPLDALTDKCVSGGLLDLATAIQGSSRRDPPVAIQKPTQDLTNFFYSSKANKPITISFLWFFIPLFSLDLL